MSVQTGMAIQVDNLSRHFGQKTIFQGVSFRFDGPGLFGITGSNGKGKTSLLKILCGFARPNGGTVRWARSGVEIELDQLSQVASLSGPYIDLPDYLRLDELIRLHEQMLGRRFRETKRSEVLDMAGLSAHKQQFIQDFSSGMKQRVRLMLTFLTDVPFWLLDEPSSNLDAAGFEFYSHNIRQEKNIRLILVASNQPESELIGATSMYEL